ncbi:TniB family NTP-binding protein [Neobacillus sp. YIM B06451]|uniref:TniB family NTP-binding protein n=1 Tax=Neobacillus sp. YIM B06451 TaxID=3070994 RepID=UPI00292E2B93|nr:TniB family NTP-binding protein [Neobacillus sp. YIM B06451]
MQKIEGQAYSSMTIEQKMEKIKTIRIVHPRFKKILDAIKECHESTAISKDPQCMLITGPSGSGKSTLLESYIQFHDRVTFDGTQTKRKILGSEIPSPTKIPAFLEAMLEQLGDPFPNSGKVGNKNRRLVKQIKNCGVELIMLDEFQHFVHRENQKINFEVADCFKSLINRTKVPVVLFGLEDAETVLESNPQLKRRFSMRETLPPFGVENTQRIREFQMLLHQIDKQLPFDELTGIGEENFANRIMYATDGIMNSIMKLIRNAALNAIKQGKEKIDLTDLAKSYHMHSYILKGKENNPFIHETFKL